jgi:hypothetical protein
MGAKTGGLRVQGQPGLHRETGKKEDRKERKRRKEGSKERRKEKKKNHSIDLHQSWIGNSFLDMTPKSQITINKK